MCNWLNQPSRALQQKTTQYKRLGFLCSCPPPKLRFHSLSPCTINCQPTGHLLCRQVGYLTGDVHFRKGVGTNCLVPPYPCLNPPVEKKFPQQSVKLTSKTTAAAALSPDSTTCSCCCLSISYGAVAFERCFWMTGSVWIHSDTGPVSATGTALRSTQTQGEPSLTARES